jgi:hypothetical protein
MPSWSCNAFTTASREVRRIDQNACRDAETCNEGWPSALRAATASVLGDALGIAGRRAFHRYASLVDIEDLHGQVMHTLYVAAHGTAVALGGHVADLQQRLGCRAPQSAVRRAANRSGDHCSPGRVKTARLLRMQSEIQAAAMGRMRRMRQSRCVQTLR